MLPGKKYTFQDVLRILRRQWWLVLLPTVVGLAGAWLYARQLPNRYRSETVIMLVPQRIPDSYVKSTVTARIEDRLATLKDQILSRSRLERIILDLDLYPVERHQRTMEDVVQQMRDAIVVGVVGTESFRVSYVNVSGTLAQQVTERLASLFIDENLRDRENIAEDTNRFLDSQLEDAKRRLIAQERKLEAYRRRYSGQLPSQLAANLQSIQNTQVQRTALAQAADRERERRVNLERQLADLQAPDPNATGIGAVVAPATPESTPGETTAEQLEAARAGLRLLELRNTADHPDVRLMQRRIRDLEEKLRLEQGAGETSNTEPKRTAADVIKERRVRAIQAQLADVDRQLQDFEERDLRLREQLRDYQAKIDAVPTRESELVELTRDYSTLQSSYESLLAKREESKIAANLERRNIGEQFRVLDPARVPERPFSPDRREMHLFGAGAGFLFGLALIGFLEYRDSGMRTEEDVLRALSLPVLVVVPLMRTTPEIAGRRRQRRLGFMTGTFVLVCWIIALAVWKL